MRKVTKEAYEAFINKEIFISSNTSVLITDEGEAEMFLFGNKIAKTKNDETFISGGGYKVTASTIERLSAFAPIRRVQHKFILREKLWDGNWIKI